MYKLYHGSYFGKFSNLEDAYKKIYSISQREGFLIDSFLIVQGVIESYTVYTDAENNFVITDPNW